MTKSEEIPDEPRRGAQERHSTPSATILPAPAPARSVSHHRRNAGASDCGRPAPAPCVCRAASSAAFMRPTANIQFPGRRVLALLPSAAVCALFSAEAGP
jgi:hypothetical protein